MPTHVSKHTATGLRKLLIVLLKLIRPKPVMTAPIKGKRGINQAKSAAGGILTNEASGSVRRSGQLSSFYR